MRARNNWVLVSLASVVMTGVVGVSAYNRYVEPLQPVVTTPVRTELPSGNWKAHIAGVVDIERPTATTSYRAPSGISAGEKMAREIAAGYLEEARDGSFSDSDKARILAGTASRNAPSVAPARTYTAADVVVDDKSDAVDYTARVINALKKSDAVTAFEIETFSRSIGARNYLGTPSLTEAAKVYTGIETELAGMRVPPAFISDHVALLNAVALLAESTKLMGSWGGDPILALAYMDAFVRADRDATVATSRFFSTVKRVLARS